MYKDKEKQRETDRERQRRYRKGVIKQEGVTEGQQIVDNLKASIHDYHCDKANKLTAGITCPDIIDKLTDKAYRVKLGKICHAFKVSHHPSYASDVWLGITEGVTVKGSTNLSVACDYLECTG